MSRLVNARLSRRHFVAAAAGLAAFGPAWRDARGDDDPYGGFRLGVQSYSFREFTLEQALQRTRALGLRWVEFSRGHVPSDGSPDQIKAVVRLCREYEVTPIAYGVQSFTRDHDANKRIFDFARQLGVKYLSANPAPDSFDSLDKLCAEYQIAIAIHPHGPAHRGEGGEARLDRWWNARLILKAVQDRHPLIGSCLDTGHLIRCGIVGKQLDVPDEIRVMGARNFGIHLKDNDNARDENVVLGKGQLDVTATFKALKEVGFRGYVSLEYEANPKDPSPDVAACLEVVKASIRRLA